MSVLAKLRQAFNIIVGARNALIDKGETVEYDDDIPQIIEDMDTGGDIELIKKIIERPSNTDLVIPEGVTQLGSWVFYSFSTLQRVSLPRGLMVLGRGCFFGSSITEINLPNTITTIQAEAFGYCNSLIDVVIENGFNANSLNLSSYNMYSVETIVSWLNALADRTGQTAYTLTIGSINLAKLTSEQKAIATNKNWNLA